MGLWALNSVFKHPSSNLQLYAKVAFTVYVPASSKTFWIGLLYYTISINSLVSLNFILDYSIYFIQDKNQNSCTSYPFPKRLAPCGNSSFHALQKTILILPGMRTKSAYKQRETNCKVTGEKMKKKWKKGGEGKQMDTNKQYYVRWDMHSDACDAAPRFFKEYYPVFSW